MYFEPGKYYQNAINGSVIRTLVITDTTRYGRVLLSEAICDGRHYFIPVGIDSERYAQDYVEITKKEWLKYASQL
jgi:hypothetical protein